MIGQTEILHLSDKVTVHVAVMDGYELALADVITSKIIGSDSIKDGNFPMMEMILIQMRVYGVCSIRKVNDEVVNPLKSRLEWAAVASRLSPRDYNALQAWAQPQYNPSEEELKKVSSAPSLEMSQDS